MVVMSLYKKEDGSEKKKSILNKAATLNPFAAEFIPSSQKSSSIAARALHIETTRESFAESGVSVSNCSDVTDEDAALVLEPPSFLLSSAMPSGDGAIGGLPFHCEDFNSEKCLNLPNDPWDEQNLPLCVGNFMDIMVNDRSGESKIDGGTDFHSIEVLCSQFPEFAAESLTEVYFANGCDLSLTIDMLTQLELQVDGNTNDEKAPGGLDLTVTDFPALPMTEKQNGPSESVGNDSQKGDGASASDKWKMLLFNGSSSLPSQKAVDFAAAVKKLASQNSVSCKLGKKSSSHSSSAGAGSCENDHPRGICTDRLHDADSDWSAPLWLETGDAVANMYAEMRKEARDHARLRNACFQQATQAYLLGNKALAKELSLKGKLHNIEMKEAHAKAQESIYRKRNPVGAVGKKHGRGGAGQMIDLHGLHVREALCVLKHELDALRKLARASDHHFPVYVCVGTGHHTKGSRTPARLPISVQRYLLEHEHLCCSEPQPGLLRVVV